VLCVQTFILIKYLVAWLQPIKVLAPNGYRMRQLIVKSSVQEARANLTTNPAFIKTSMTSNTSAVADVALLKGELWEGNEKAGLVHRSPAVPADHRRLLLTLDFSQ